MRGTKKLRGIVSLLAAAALMCGLLAGCGSGGDSASGGKLDPKLPTYDSLKVGEDYTGLGVFGISKVAR